VRARVAASAGLAALMVMALAGCNFITPQQTLVPYESSDGVSGRVGDVDVLNAVVLSDQEGDYVFVVNAQNVVVRQSVVKGPLNGADRAITGVTAADRVVVNGIPNIHTGQSVNATLEQLPTPEATPEPILEATPEPSPSATPEATTTPEPPATPESSPSASASPK